MDGLIKKKSWSPTPSQCFQGGWLYLLVLPHFLFGKEKYRLESCLEALVPNTTSLMYLTSCHGEDAGQGEDRREMGRNSGVLGC